MLDITLPALPGGSAVVRRWLVAEGEAVAPGTPLALLLTDAVEVALPAPGAGVLQQPVAAGTTLEPGALLARLARARRATPLARRIATVHGLDLAAFAASRGAVRAAEVRAALVQAPGSAGEHQPQRAEEPPAAARLRGLCGLCGSTTIPLASTAVEVDLSAALARVRPPVDLLACLVWAAAACLPAYGALNSHWSDEGIVLRRRVHIAAAAPVGNDALHWRTVADAGDLTLRGIARALGSPAAEPPASTFAVAYGGPAGSWQSALAPLTATAAALHLGVPARRAVVVGEAIAIRPVALLVLSHDARVVDHHAAATFLRAVSGCLERM